jgi:hypothetical protein
MEIRFTGTYAKKYVINALNTLMKATKKKNYFATGLYIVCFVVFIIFGIQYLQGKTSSTINIGRMLRMAITIVFLTYFVFQAKINYWISSNQIWNSLKNTSTVTGYVHDLGITFISSTGEEYQCLWKIFVTKIITSDVSAMLDASGTVTILQRDFFESEKDWKRATDIIEYKVKEVVNG